MRVSGEVSGAEKSQYRTKVVSQETKKVRTGEEALVRLSETSQGRTRSQAGGGRKEKKAGLVASCSKARENNRGVSRDKGGFIKDYKCKSDLGGEEGEGAEGRQKGGRHTACKDVGESYVGTGKNGEQRFFEHGASDPKKEKKARIHAREAGAFQEGIEPKGEEQKKDQTAFRRKGVEFGRR